MISSRPARFALRALLGLAASVMLPSLLLPGSAQAQGKLDARYEATLAGIPVGKGAWTIDISDDTFSASASGGTSGVGFAIANTIASSPYSPAVVVRPPGVMPVIDTKSRSARPYSGHHRTSAPPAKPPSYVEVPDMLVNLIGLPGERVQYLKAKIVLEVKEEKQAEAIKPSLPRVTDIFQTYLRELRPSDLAGSAGLFRLKEDLTRRVNAAVAPNQVNAVLFKEVVIQ